MVVEEMVTPGGLDAVVDGATPSAVVVGAVASVVVVGELVVDVPRGPMPSSTSEPMKSALSPLRTLSVITRRRICRSPAVPTTSRSSMAISSPSRKRSSAAVSYTHLRAHETVLDIVCRLLLAKKNS